jgi:hypothetical protein
MKNFGIRVGQLTSSICFEEQKSLFDSCLYDNSNFPKIIYLTPEKVSQSETLMSFLKKLDSKKRLDR